MTRFAIHDDPPCQEPLDSNGMCPACNVIPDMQSVAMVDRDWLLRNRPAVSGAEMRRRLWLLEERKRK